MEDALWKNVREHLNLSDFAIILYLYFSRRCRRTGSFLSSERRIATAWQRGAMKVHRAVVELVEAGLLTAEASGANRKTTYRVRITSDAHSGKESASPAMRASPMMRTAHHQRCAPYKSAGARTRDPGVTPRLTPGVTPEISLEGNAGRSTANKPARSKEDVQRVNRFIQTLNISFGLNAEQAERQRRSFAAVGYRVLAIDRPLATKLDVLRRLQGVADAVARKGEPISKWQRQVETVFERLHERNTHNTAARP